MVVEVRLIPIPISISHLLFRGRTHFRRAPRREEAYKAFSATPFFQAWDPASLDIYVQSALYDAPDGQVRLKMPGVQEGVCFAENYAPYETFELLSSLDQSVELRWLVSGKLTPP